MKNILTLCTVAALGALLAIAACGGEDPPELDTVSQAVHRACGGFAGTLCPAGQECVDDPRDSCDPKTGGADCIGICRRGNRSGCNDRAREYVSRNLNECARIRFICASGAGFSDQCGCGCLSVCTDAECGPAPAAPTVQCDDGTSAGPECGRVSDGSCGWTITSCP